MKTVRHNTFETNSSSTHSITIVNTTEPTYSAATLSDPIDQVLYPARLRECETRFNDKYSSTTKLHASDLDTKAALLVHQLTNFFDDNFHEEWCAEYLLKVYDVIKDECGYTDICTDSFYASYDINDRYGCETNYPEDFPPLDFLGRTLSNKPTVDLDRLRIYIREYVANPFITIIDTSESY